MGITIFQLGNIFINIILAKVVRELTKSVNN